MKEPETHEEVTNLRKPRKNKAVDEQRAPSIDQRVALQI